MIRNIEYIILLFITLALIPQIAFSYEFEKSMPEIELTESSDRKMASQSLKIKSCLKDHNQNSKYCHCLLEKNLNIDFCRSSWLKNEAYDTYESEDSFNTTANEFGVQRTQTTVGASRLGF